MRKSLIGVAFLGAFLTLASRPAAAQEVELSYDDGTASGGVSLTPGDIEVVRFYAEHPSTVLSVRLWFQLAVGPTTLVLWADDGGNAPDTNVELYRVEITPTAGEWTTVDVSVAGLEVKALENFYVGHIVQDSSTILGWDASGSEDHHSLARIGPDWFYIGDGTGGSAGVDALVRATVMQHDVAASHWFVDDTEALAGGTSPSRMAWGDYDNDGDPDLLVNGNALYQNDGDGTFTNVSEAAGIAGTGTNGGIWADFDNDGHLDFYATMHNYLPLCGGPTDCIDGYSCVDGRCKSDSNSGARPHDILYKNSGDGTFIDVTDSAGGVYDFYPTEGAAWGDMDADGCVDLYVANYETPTAWTDGVLSVGTPDYLWHNNCDGTFTDESETSGIRGIAEMCGRGVNWADYDDDGWMDIFVSNYRLDPNLLWKNRGDGYYENVSGNTGTAGILLSGAYGHTIGSQWADVNNDGYWDLFTANLAHPRFIEFSDKSMMYISSGPPSYTFTDIRASAGITYYETHSDTAFGDFDNDGYIDLFVTGVYVGYRSFLYRNQGNETFADETYRAGTFIDNGWGATWADVDNDGDLDFVSKRLYRNETPNVGNWVKVRLVGRQSNRSAIGAKVVIKAGGQTLMRQVEGGKGTTTQNDLTLHFGLGTAETITELEITWPSQPPWIESYGNVEPGRTVTYIEGLGEQMDAGVTPDASGTDPGPKKRGCQSGGSGGRGVLLLGLLALLAVRRRRRPPRG